MGCVSYCQRNEIENLNDEGKVSIAEKYYGRFVINE